MYVRRTKGQWGVLKTKQKREKRVVYEVPCWDCAQVYIGETSQTLKKRISEHKQVVKWFDDKNGIAVHIS